ncbi:MAG TPA: cytochrome P450 [Myxococcales bacterium]|nr:cytochrome P450 [Myxococcales bacterium]
MLARIGRAPLAGFLELKKRYGKAARLPGPLPQTVLFTPAAVEQVLISLNKSFGRGLINGQFQLLDGLGLVTSEGDLWIRQRRMAQPLFHRQKLGALGAVMAEEAARAAERWSAHARSGRPFNVIPELMKLTLQSASRTLFGVELEHSAARVGPAVDAARSYLTWRAKFAFLPRWFPGPGSLRFRRARRTLDGVVYGLIAQRRREGAQGRADLLSLFLQATDADTGATMDDRQVRDEVMTLLMAGHESTAVTLSWVFLLLGRHPDVQRKAREELDAALGGRAPSAEDVPKLAFLRMVIDETLRLYPPVWGMSRQAVEDVVVDGVRIPRGEHVMLMQWAVHRDPAVWDAPDEFRPERFAPAAAEGRSRGAYFPFGAGPRSCIGNHFALMEAMLVTATALQRYELHVAEDHPAALDPQISLRLAGGVWITLRERPAPPAAARATAS